jgi:hypothetical protein
VVIVLDQGDARRRPSHTSDRWRVDHVSDRFGSLDSVSASVLFCATSRCGAASRCGVSGTHGTEGAFNGARDVRFVGIVRSLDPRHDARVNGTDGTQGALIARAMCRFCEVFGSMATINSFVTQRLHRIKPRYTRRRPHAGGERHADDDHGDAGNRDRIPRSP